VQTALGIGFGQGLYDHRGIAPAFGFWTRGVLQKNKRQKSCAFDGANWPNVGQTRPSWPKGEIQHFFAVLDTFKLSLDLHDAIQLFILTGQLSAMVASSGLPRSSRSSQ